VSFTVHMVDLSEFAEMNRVNAEYFKAMPPGRTSVQGVALPAVARIENTVTRIAPVETPQWRDPDGGRTLASMKPDVSAFGCWFEWILHSVVADLGDDPLRRTGMGWTTIGERCRPDFTSHSCSRSLLKNPPRQ
jgi:hypothetical protein